MTRLTTGILLVAISLTFFTVHEAHAKPPADSAADARRTVDKSGQFSYITPQGWLAAPMLTDHAHDVLFLPSDDGKNRNVVIVDQKGGSELDALRRKYEPALAAALKDFKLVSSATVKLPDSREAVRIEHTNSNPGITVRQINYIIGAGPRRYFITCTLLPEDKEKFDGDFKAFVASIQPVK